MIVYRDQHFRAESRPLLEQLQSQLQHLQLHSSAAHDSIVEAFIAAGTLEAAIADAIFPEADGVHHVTSLLRQVSLAAGHMLWHSWHSAPDAAAEWRTRTLDKLEELALHPLPSPVEVTTPEGFAFYAVFPEAYLEAARHCRAELGPFSAVCIGLRSIGTTLSAAVAAGLEELGCTVRSYTVRPRGHPYSRQLALEPALEAELAQDSSARFLLIDEGPGISGSSLAGAAERLSRLGIPDSHIVLMPSWKTDGTHLRSAEARERWPRHRQFTVDFEKLWIDSGRMGRDFPGWSWCDLSAGAWRRELFTDSAQYPAVQPQHERRKYLLQSDSGAQRAAKWLSFAGLGRRCGATLRRAEQLAEAGFTPAPEGTLHGFLVRAFVPGSPVRAEDVDAELLETIARYLAHLSCQHQTEPSLSSSALREMAVNNVAEGLEPPWEERLGGWLPSPHEWSERPVAGDARMQAHEWLRTSNGYVKTDAFDHYDDHFFPGCQDIAWDVAGAVYELDLDLSARRRLVERYRALSGDRTVRSRLPQYAACYLAYRLGYTSLASSTLGSSPDGLRFSRANDRYARLLRQELTQGPRVSWDV